MTWLKRIAYLLCFVVLLAVVSGCEDNQGAGEKLGKQFDQAMDSAKDKMDEMSDQAKEAYDKAKDKVDEAVGN